MSSSLNSTSTPLLAGTSWEGSHESCKNYATISCSLLADTQGKLTIYHLDKNGNTQWAEEYSTVSNTMFYKQVVSKSTHFKVKFENQDYQTDQQTCRLVTKLSNSPPDNINVSLTHTEDSVSAFLMTSTGGLVSDGDNKLLVSQKQLTPQTDGVLCHGMDSDTGVETALSVNASGHLKVAVQSAAVWNNCLNNTSLQTTPSLLVSGAGKVMRLNAFNDATQLRYLRIYDQAAEPVYSDSPKAVVVLPHNTSVNVELGFNFYNNLYIVASANSGATTAYGVVDADEVCVNIVCELPD